MLNCKHCIHILLVHSISMFGYKEGLSILTMYEPKLWWIIGKQYFKSLVWLYFRG